MISTAKLLSSLWYSGSGQLGFSQMLGRICDNMPEESAEEHGSDHTVQTDFRFNTGLMIHNTGGTWLEVLEKFVSLCLHLPD